MGKKTRDEIIIELKELISEKKASINKMGNRP